jgi:polysaccharide biosynthesis/export protein
MWNFCRRGSNVQGGRDGAAFWVATSGTRLSAGIRILKFQGRLLVVRFRGLVALCLGVALAGCQAVPGSGPQMIGASRETTEALPFDVLDLTPVSVTPYRPVFSIDRPSTTSNLAVGGRPHVAAGDVLKVRIFERYDGSIFPTIRGSDAVIPPQRVTDEGTITIPFIGTVQVAGLDLEQIEQRIATQRGSRAQNPQVIVEIVADRTNTVMISGEVRLPGRFSMLEGTRTILDVINKAGGPTPSIAPAQLEVVVRRHDQIVHKVQYPELLAGGDLPVQRGDEIVVRSNARIFTVLGALRGFEQGSSGSSGSSGSPGTGSQGSQTTQATQERQGPNNKEQQPLKSANIEINKQGMTLLDALGAAGGLSDERADKKGVFLFRPGGPGASPAGRSTIFKLDMSQPVSIFVAQEFAIQPNDVLYVTNAPLYEYNRILSALFQSAVGIRMLTGTLQTYTF